MLGTKLQQAVEDFWRPLAEILIFAKLVLGMSVFAFIAAASRTGT